MGKRTFLMDGSEHIIGDRECPACFDDYPQLCDECGGLLHKEFRGEGHISGEVYLVFSERCDTCEIEEAE